LERQRWTAAPLERHVFRHGIASEPKDSQLLIGIIAAAAQATTEKSNRHRFPRHTHIISAPGLFEPKDWQLRIEIIPAAAEAITQEFNMQMLPHHTLIIALIMFAVRSRGADVLGALAEDKSRTCRHR